MNKYGFAVAFALGLLGLAWTGASFIDSSPLALVMTVIIAAVYCAGALELRQFRQNSAALTAALSAIPENIERLADWLQRLPPSLRDPVRLRVEGQVNALPGPALTPFLVGLLVMLGMLGTFLGMVVTLKGAVFALEKTADLQAMRSALALPVKGLGLAFGTSVAGVLASAMLGLMSALARRERMQAVQLLDSQAGAALRRFSLAHQRQESFKAMQAQAEALPALVERLQSMMQQLESSSRQLDQRLLHNQQEFHSQAKEAYTGLARSVEQSLRESLSRSAELAIDNLKPTVESAMNTLAREASLMHERSASTAQLQLEALSSRLADNSQASAAAWDALRQKQEQASASMLAALDASLRAFNASFEQRSGQLLAELGQSWAGLQAAHAQDQRQQQQAWVQALQSTASSLAAQWQQAGADSLSQQQEAGQRLLAAIGDVASQAREEAAATRRQAQGLVASAEELLQTRMASEAAWMEQHQQRMEQLAALLRSELGALRDAEAARAQAAVERLGQLQSALAEHLSTLGRALEEPITRLIDTASQAPRAAAEVIAQLRQEIANSTARDNALLEERSRIMQTLDSLLQAINHATGEQRAVIDSLVANSVEALKATSESFSSNVASETARLSEVAAQVSSSAVDVSSLGEAFGLAVQSFSEANGKLIANLAQIEGAMDRSLARSDEQLAYYVAQAREIIDLSMRSQQAFVEELRRVPARPANPADALPEEAG